MNSYEWSLLGIEPTHDEEEIRHAYARQLKHCHPEEEPERWSRLHSAYRHALSFAGGEETQPDVPFDQSRSRAEPDEPDIPLADAFDAALAQPEPDEAGTLPKRFEKVRRAKDADAFLETIRALPLRSGGEETLQAIDRAVRGIKPRRLTREALTKLVSGLWECAEALPQTAVRTRLEKYADQLGKSLADPEEIWKGDVRDLRFVCRVTLGIGLPLLALMPQAQMLRAVTWMLITVMPFYAALRRRPPRLRRERRAERGRYEKRSARLLAAAIAIMLVFGVASVGAQEDLEPKTETTPVETERYRPGLAESTPVSLTVAEPPEYICTSAQLEFTEASPAPLEPNMVRTHFYTCVTDQGERAILSVTEAQRAEAEALFAHCPFTVWGETGPAPVGGWYIRTQEGNFTDATVEQQLQNFNILRSLASDYGQNSVVSYRSDEPLETDSPVAVSLGTQIAFVLIGTLYAGGLALVLLRLLRRWL